MCRFCIGCVGVTPFAAAPSTATPARPRFVAVLNIIFGIIVDKFGELRAENALRHADCKNRCFICGPFPLSLLSIGIGRGCGGRCSAE